MTPSPLHATVVARAAAGGWRAVLLRGPSGAGKSDLALRLIGSGWRLVTDDYAQVWASGGAAYATAPARIAGRIEARGIGILSAPTRTIARVVLLVDCVQTAVERLPEARMETVCGVPLPRLSLDIRPASAAIVLSLAMERL